MCCIPTSVGSTTPPRCPKSYAKAVQKLSTSAIRRYLPTRRDADEHDYSEAYGFAQVLSAAMCARLCTVLCDPRSPADRALSDAHAQIVRIEQAQSAWMATVEPFAGRAALHLQEEVDALPENARHHHPADSVCM